MSRRASTRRPGKKRKNSIAGDEQDPNELAKRDMLAQLKSGAKESVLGGIEALESNPALLQHGLAALLPIWLSSSEPDVVVAATRVVAAYCVGPTAAAEPASESAEFAPLTSAAAFAGALALATELKGAHKSKWIEVLTKQVAKPVAEELRAPIMACMRSFVNGLCIAPAEKVHKFLRDLIGSAAMIDALAKSIVHHELVAERGGGWEDQTSLDALACLTLLASSKASSARALPAISGNEGVREYLVDFAARTPFGWGSAAERELLSGTRALLDQIGGTKKGALVLGASGLAAFVAAIRDEACVAPTLALASISALICATPEVEGVSAALSAVVELVRPDASGNLVAAACRCVAAIFAAVAVSSEMRTTLIVDPDLGTVARIAAYICAEREAAAAEEPDAEGAAVAAATEEGIAEATSLLDTLLTAALSEESASLEGVLASTSEAIVAGLTRPAPAGQHAARTARRLLALPNTVAALCAAGADATLLAHVCATLPRDVDAVLAASAAEARAASDCLYTLGALYSSSTEDAVETEAPSAETVEALGSATHAAISASAGAPGHEVAAMLAGALPLCFSTVSCAAAATDASAVYNTLLNVDGLLAAICGRVQQLCAAEESDGTVVVGSILRLLACAISTPESRVAVLGAGAESFDALYVGLDAAAQIAERDANVVALVQTATCVIGSTAVAAPTAAAALSTLRMLCLAPSEKTTKGEEDEEGGDGSTKGEELGATIAALQQAQIAVQIGVLPACMTFISRSSDAAASALATDLVRHIVGAAGRLVGAVRSIVAQHDGDESAAEDALAECGASGGVELADAARVKFAASLDAATPASALPSGWGYWHGEAPCCTPPLFVASLDYKKHASIVADLIAAGVDLNTEDESGATALLQSLLFGIPAAAHALLDAGADPNRSSATLGCSVLKAAFVMPSRRKLKAAATYVDEHATGPTVVKGSASMKLLSKLIALGVDVNTCEENGSNPLLWVITGCRVLLQCGQTVTVELRSSTASFGPGSNVAERVSELLAAGANVNDGSVGPTVTPLHAALQRGMVDVADVLLSAGANPNVVCDDGMAIHVCLHSALGGPALLDRILLAGRTFAVVDIAVSEALLKVRRQRMNLDSTGKLINDAEGILNDGRDDDALRSTSEAGPTLLMPTMLALLTTADARGFSPLHCACGGADVFDQLRVTKCGPSGWIEHSWLMQREGTMFIPRLIEDVARDRVAMAKRVVSLLSDELGRAAAVADYAAGLDAEAGLSSIDAQVLAAFPEASAALRSRWDFAAEMTIESLVNATRDGSVEGGFTPVIAAACWDAAFDLWRKASTEEPSSPRASSNTAAAARVTTLLDTVASVGGKIDATCDVFVEVAEEGEERDGFANGGDVFTPLTVGLVSSESLAQ